MPPVSQKQRRAMFAAASGHSTLGILKKVGREFVAADTGRDLPERAKKVHETMKRRIGGR